MCDKIGVMLHVTEALLNHAKGGVEGIYNRTRHLKECRRRSSGQGVGALPASSI